MTSNTYCIQLPAETAKSLEQIARDKGIPVESVICHLLIGFAELGEYYRKANSDVLS